MNSNSKKYDYQWLYEEVEKLFIRKRVPLLILYVLSNLVSLIISVRFQGSDRERIVLLYFCLLLVTLVFLAYVNLYESYKRDNRVEQCANILTDSNMKLDSAKGCESRAAVDIGAARAFLFLPGLILTLMIPLTFSTLTNTYPSDESATPLFVNRIVDEVPSNVLETLSKDEWAAVVLVLLSIIIAMILFLQLERANISIIIQHACIEYEVMKRNKSSERVSVMICENLKRSSGQEDINPNLNPHTPP